MIYARPSATFVAEFDGAPTGLAGTIGVQIVSRPAGVVALARTTAGIAETPAGSGLYTVALTAPTTLGDYDVLWDTGGATPRYAREPLEVTGAATPADRVLGPGAYAGPGDLADWLLDSDVTAPAAADELERLLLRASRDVDNVLGPIPVITLGAWAGAKLDPTTLQPYEANALARATCAQAEHRIRRGPGIDTSRPVGLVKGPDFQEQFADAGNTGRYSPRLPAELAPIQHLRRLTALIR